MPQRRWRSSGPKRVGATRYHSALARAALTLAIAAAAVSCGQNNQYAAPPPPKVTVAAPVEQQVTRYLESTGNTAADQLRRSCRARARLRAGDQLHRRRFRQEGHLAVHHRARALQAQVDAAKASVDQRAGFAGASGGRFQAASPSRYQPVRPPAPVRPGARAARLRPAPTCSRRKPTSSRPRSIRLYPRDRAVRRRGHRTSGFGRRPGRRQSAPTELATIVQLDPIYVNFNVSEQDVLRIRATLRAAAASRPRSDRHAGRGRADDRDRLSAPRHARLRGARRRSVDRHAGGARHVLENADRALLPGYFVRVRIPSTAAAGAAGARRRARHRPGRALRAGGRQGRRRRAAQGRDRAAGRRCA